MIKQGDYTTVNPKLLALELYETLHMEGFIEINLAKETHREPLRTISI
jgi:hypothetical protein